MNLDGVRAEETKSSLRTDVTEEITCAQNFSKRIKELDGQVPGSMEFKVEQAVLHPPHEDLTDVVKVIKD